MSTIRVDNFGPSAGGTTYSARGIAKAWVNFDGTGTIAARDSENVSSLTDNGTGNYTINFSSAFGAGDYAATAGSSDGGPVHILRSFATTSFVIACNSLAGAGTDSAIVTASVNGDLA
jgi:hypothetical protein